MQSVSIMLIIKWVKVIAKNTIGKPSVAERQIKDLEKA